MEYIDGSDSLQAALIRRQVSGSPRDGDEAILQTRIDDILAEENDDGTLSSDPDHRIQFTAEKLIELAGLGIDPRLPEVRLAVDVLLTERSDDGDGILGLYGVRALCMLGMADEPAVKEGLQRIIDQEKEWNGPDKGCPWTPAVHLEALWDGRDIIDTTPLIDSVLRWIGEQMNNAGCLSYNDPWGFTGAAGLISTPAARRIVERQIPMILRGQHADGGWGHHSVAAVRALVTHGYFEDLRQQLPIRPDWRVVRELPLPSAKMSDLSFDGELLWMRDWEAREAIAVSPADGTVARRVALPEGRVKGLSWWDGTLAVTMDGPKRLIRLDPETGEPLWEASLAPMEWVGACEPVGDEVWVADGFMCRVARMKSQELAQPDWLTLAGPGPQEMAATPDGVWHVDWWAPALIKSDADGHLLDWGEKPFECRGLAWDGEQLWALDGESQRLCVIERAE